VKGPRCEVGQLSGRRRVSRRAHAARGRRRAHGWGTTVGVTYLSSWAVAEASLIPAAGFITRAHQAPLAGVGGGGWGRHLTAATHRETRGHPATCLIHPSRVGRTMGPCARENAAVSGVVGRSFAPIRLRGTDHPCASDARPLVFALPEPIRSRDAAASPGREVRFRSGRGPKSANPPSRHAVIILFRLLHERTSAHWSRPRFRGEISRQRCLLRGISMATCVLSHCSKIPAAGFIHPALGIGEKFNLRVVRGGVPFGTAQTSGARRCRARLAASTDRFAPPRRASASRIWRAGFPPTATPQAGSSPPGSPGRIPASSAASRGAASGGDRAANLAGRSRRRFLHGPIDHRLVLTCFRLHPSIHESPACPIATNPARRAMAHHPGRTAALKLRAVRLRQTARAQR